jgi:VWFA-related protein
LKGLVALLFAVLAGAQERRDVPTFPSRAELVTVDAVVLDRAGQPVRGLTMADFILSEDGRPQAIVSFEAIDMGTMEPRAAGGAVSTPVATNVRSGRPAASSFVLLVDDLSLAPSRSETVRTALTRFLAEGARDGDELIFATTSGDTWWTARMPEGARTSWLSLPACAGGASPTRAGTR